MNTPSLSDPGQCGPSTDDETKEAPNPRVPRSRGGVLLAVVAAAMIALALLQTRPGQRLLAFAALAPRPSPFLELYFAYPGGNPTDVTPSSALVQVAFVVRSHDLDVNDQGWTISVSDGTVTQTASSGSLSLGQGQQVTVQRGVVVPCSVSSTSTRRKVSVSLDHTQQTIEFWLNCDSGATRPAVGAS